MSRLRLLNICLVRVAMGVQQNSTCNSNKYILTNSFFQPTDKIASFVTHRTYSCPNYEKFYVTCNSSNLIHTITCSDCLMQYVGESAQQLNMRFVTHRASISGKIKSNSCKWLAGQITEKSQGNCRTNCGAIDFGEVVLWRKRETEWMLK